MPEVKYQGDKGQGQKAQAVKFGNQLNGQQPTKVYPQGYQAQRGPEPMKPSEDIWTSFKPTKGTTI